jgi:hypothetical protein
MIEAINDKALAARSRRPEDIRELVEAVFLLSGFDSPGSVLLAHVRDRIARAEAGRHLVDEHDARRAYNWVMKEFSAPDFAKVSPLQFKTMRLILSGITPNLFDNPDVSDKWAAFEKAMDGPPAPFSAAQAAAIMFFTLDQKVRNEFFQKELALWDADFLAEREAVKRRPRPDADEREDAVLVARRQPEKSRELRRLFYETEIDLTVLLSGLHGALDRLGVSE